MPSIRGSLEHLQPLVDVSIGSGQHGVERRTYRGLIDTGATRTCLTRRVIAAHALEPRVRMLVQSARTGPERRWAYAFSLGLFCQTEDRLGAATTLFVLAGEFAAPDFQDNDNFDVLIGMDLLSTGRFVIDRQAFSFTF